MRLIGLIGGLGPAATVHYYTELVAEASRRGVELRLLINHADVGRVLELASRGDRGGLADHLAELARELERAGADVLAICAVTPHLCAPELAEQLNTPLVDLVSVVQAEVQRRGFQRVALLGTHMVVESRLFGRLPVAVAPSDASRVQRIHDLYTSIVRRGGVDREAAAALRALAAELVDSERADGLLLAGTELALAPPDVWRDLPVLDCAGAHVGAIIDAAQRS